MNTKEDIIRKYKKYVLKKSLFNALSIILSYIIVILLISVTPKLFDIIFLKGDSEDIFVFISFRIKETIKMIYNWVPLKDNILTALGAQVLTLFINVRSENKEINGKSGHEVAKARAYKTFSDIIICILGFIMFINFWTKILLSDTINSNDQIAPWVSLFFMFFILMVRSLEGDSVESIRKQIRQAKSRASTINVRPRTLIKPKYGIKYNHILHHYEHSEPFLDPIRKGCGYVRLKYNIRNAFPKMLFQFLFTFDIFYTVFYTVRSIERISYFPSIKQDYTLEKFIQYSIQVFHQAPYITLKDSILVCLFSISTSIIFIFLDVIYNIISNLLNIHSENNSYGATLKTLYFIIEFSKFGSLAILLLYIINNSVYTFLEIPLFTYTLIISIIGYIVINKISNRNYTQNLNRDLGLPIDQSLNDTKTSAELYYLNTKLESLDDILKTLLEEAQDNYTQWKNSSNTDSDNINSSCE